MTTTSEACARCAGEALIEAIREVDHLRGTLVHDDLSDHPALREFGDRVAAEANRLTSEWLARVAPEMP